LHPDLSKAFDLLEVKPGVSNRELKAAHRDLAKVWHPDRFLHDARLQEKAQEKLKEINKAYELLISGKVPNATPSRSAETVYSQPQRRRNQQFAMDGSSFAHLCRCLCCHDHVFTATPPADAVAG